MALPRDFLRRRSKPNTNLRNDRPLVKLKTKIAIASNSYAQIYSAVISGDGSTVAFTDNAPLTSIPTNGEQIYSRNWLASDPTTTLVSVNATGDGGANDYTENPSISDNGQVIAFDSRATNLVGNDPNANHHAQILVRDLGTNTGQQAKMDVMRCLTFVYEVFAPSQAVLGFDITQRQQRRADRFSSICQLGWILQIVAGLEVGMRSR
jgi:hypothetical protein